MKFKEELEKKVFDHDPFQDRMPQPLVPIVEEEKEEDDDDDENELKVN